MATYSSNDFRPGLKIIFEGEPYAVEASEFVKPGKGQAFARVKMRRLLTGTRVEKTFKSTDSAEGADVVDKDGKVIGRVCSGGFGPTLGAPLAMAYLDIAHTAVDSDVWAIVRGKTVPMKVSKMPFVAQRYYRG